MQGTIAGLLSATLGLAATAEAAESPVKADGLVELLNKQRDDLPELARHLGGKAAGNELFYFPTRDEPATPETWGCRYEAFDFKSTDGTPLHGWFIPAKTKVPKGTVVFSHGNAGSMSYHLGFVTWFAEASYNVIMYDYRGFGKSGGTVDRRGMINDVKAAFNYTFSRKDIDTSKVVSFGHSLGGAQSVTALGESPVKGLRAIIIDGTFASYQAMASVFGGQLGASLVTDELSPKDYVKNLSPVPLLVVHGTRDEVVPVSQGLQLYKEALQPKTLFEVKEGRHGTALSNDRGAYRKKVIVWLDSLMKG